MTPILYSFRRCPYAIRARLALRFAGQPFELREVLLKDKPQAMLELSPKGTVPVMQLADCVIDESLDVMRWALADHEKSSELDHPLARQIVRQNDFDFKPILDKYKYFDRYPEFSQQYYFEQAQVFLHDLEENMHSDEHQQFFLGSPELSPLDLAIAPFIRQFAMVDRVRFDQLPFPKLISWLDQILASELFLSVMHKASLWSPEVNHGHGVLIE